MTLYDENEVFRQKIANDRIEKRQIIRWFRDELERRERALGLALGPDDDFHHY